MPGKLIAIIDDEEDLLDLLEYNFTREGFEVVAFNRAKPALNFFQKEKPDMILCDWMMPEMTGIELCQMLKSHEDLGQIPFVMVTCRNEVSAINHAKSVGVTEYIKKPVRISELINKVSFLIENPAA